MRNGRDHDGEAGRGPAPGVEAQDSTSSGFIVSTDWRTGPRTRAWDELWRWLLAPEELHPSGSAEAPATSDAERQRGR
ncbi:MAG: hypothetical protein F4Z77_12085 [Dehalococcoidia bacterium]|nr:hypothetical protein [Dehalococcoidia bacterium]MYA54198.1 hypothetical protein [Dehalococcoidia bacterium]